MTEDETTSPPHGAAEPIARNLRRWRATREMTLSALAERAGVAKSTVSLIERGQGNPSIDTVWALATALGVPFQSLFHVDAPPDEMSLIREHDSPVVAVEQAGLEGDGLVIRHLLTRTGGALIEIYTLVLEHGAVRRADAHVTGLFEHITVAAGSVEISTDSFSEVLQKGDLISFRADRSHSYRVIDGPVRLVSVHEYPRRAPLD
ncbi:MAG TPA: XRE family transcriptional regulator [Solirubrobacteraceae bacterium]|jgi:transcriptional regulator with XRE-family HTH domain|nr:XRE family transcriptional regulator [Solirubrobacteraceae bacterium]